MMRINVLGSLEVLRQGVPVDVPKGICRPVLGLLTIYAGRPVGGNLIMSRLGLNADRTDKRRLLRALDQVEDVIASAAEGVRLDRGPQGASQTLHLHLLGSDLLHARALARAAAEADPGQVHPNWSAAVELWRGPVLDDLSISAGWPERRALDTERDLLLESRINACIAAHEVDDDLVDELYALTRAQPKRESWPALLIDALVVRGCLDEAEAVYCYAASRLDDHGGMDPGPALLARRELVAGLVERRVHAGTQEVAVLVVTRLPEEPSDDDELVAEIRAHDGIVVWRDVEVLMVVFDGVRPHARALRCAPALRAVRSRRGVASELTTISICSGDRERFEPANAAPLTTGPVLSGPVLSDGREQFFAAPPGVTVVDERTHRLTVHQARYRPGPVGYELLEFDVIARTG